MSVGSCKADRDRSDEVTTRAGLAARSPLRHPPASPAKFTYARQQSHSEEAFEHRSDRLRIGQMRLPVDGLTVRPRNARGDGVRSLMEGQHPARGCGRAPAARGDRGRLSDHREAGSRRLAVPQTGRIVGKGLRNGHQGGPERRTLRPRDLLLGGTRHPHEQFERGTATTRDWQCPEVLP
jgi:hypothetical protein